MSLQMHVEFVEASPEEVRDLARRARDDQGLAVTYRGIGPGCKHPALSLDEAHTALTDQADWNAQYWDMEVSALRRLDGTVMALHRIAPSDIVVWAIWIGEKAVSQRTVSPGELSAIIRNGRIETHTRYYVPKIT